MRHRIHEYPTMIRRVNIIMVIMYLGNRINDKKLRKNVEPHTLVENE